VVVSPRCQALDNGPDMSRAPLRSYAYRRRASSCFQYGLEPGRGRAADAGLAGPREHRDSYEGHNRSQEMAGSRQGEVDPLPRVDVWKHTAVPVVQGPSPFAMATDHAPTAVGLPGPGGVPSQGIFSLPGREHQRNTRNERNCCARGTRYIRELGTVPPRLVMTASELRSTPGSEMMRGRRKAMN